LLRTLVYEGYLRKAENGYVIGPSATASGRSPLQSLHPRIQPVLRSLRDELGGATYLSMYDHGEIRLVDIADGPHAQCVDLWVGVHEAGHATAFGKAILASLDPEHRDDYRNRHDLDDLPPKTITNRNALPRRPARDLVRLRSVPARHVLLGRLHPHIRSRGLDCGVPSDSSRPERQSGACASPRGTPTETDHWCPLYHHVKTSSLPTTCHSSH